MHFIFMAFWAYKIYGFMIVALVTLCIITIFVTIVC
jgi:transmembrane 9 superfamily protein 3